jgi:hypothetical protein
MWLTCHSCGRQAEVTPPLGRRDLCPHCEAELRCCRQCRFFDPASSTECREPLAEVPRDKDRANFCELFQPGSPSTLGREPAEQAKAAFDALFKK